MEKSHLKLCKFCLKQRQAMLFYRINQRKYYKYTYICNYCYPQYLEGKKIDKKTHTWVGIRKIYDKKPKHIYQLEFTKQEKENLKVSNNHYLSESLIADYFD